MWWDKSGSVHFLHNQTCVFSALELLVPLHFWLDGVTNTLENGVDLLEIPKYFCTHHVDHSPHFMHHFRIAMNPVNWCAANWTPERNNLGRFWLDPQPLFQTLILNAVATVFQQDKSKENMQTWNYLIHNFTKWLDCQFRSVSRHSRPSWKQLLWLPDHVPFIVTDFNSPQENPFC